MRLVQLMPQKKLPPSRLRLFSGRSATGSLIGVEGLKRQEERMGSDFSFSKLLLDKAEKGERFTR